MIFEELEGNFTDLVFNKRSGVVAALFAACGRFHTRQKEVCLAFLCCRWASWHPLSYSLPAVIQKEEMEFLLVLCWEELFLAKSLLSVFGTFPRTRFEGFVPSSATHFHHFRMQLSHSSLSYWSQSLRRKETVLRRAYTVSNPQLYFPYWYDDALAVRHAELWRWQLTPIEHPLRNLYPDFCI